MTDIETQDTEPLTPDAARIVELERRIVQLELRLEVEVRANDSALRFAASHAGALKKTLDQQEPVMKAALELGRLLKPRPIPSDRDAPLTALANAVEAFDALQPKG